MNKRLIERVLVDSQGNKLNYVNIGLREKAIAQTLDKGEIVSIKGRPTQNELANGSFSNMLERMADLISGIENRDGEIPVGSATKRCCVEYKGLEGDLSYTISLVDKDPTSEALNGAGIVGLHGENGIPRNDIPHMIPQLGAANEKFAPVHTPRGWEKA